MEIKNMTTKELNDLVTAVNKELVQRRAERDKMWHDVAEKVYEYLDTYGCINITDQNTKEVLAILDSKNTTFDLFYTGQIEIEREEV
jgi:L,D-peptidoglycan transpeptidase YkuD (ErfK/YbiS/YcfS/YnhG family)